MEQLVVLPDCLHWFTANSLVRWSLASELTRRRWQSDLPPAFFFVDNEPAPHPETEASSRLYPRVETELASGSSEQSSSRLPNHGRSFPSSRLPIRGR